MENPDSPSPPDEKRVSRHDPSVLNDHWEAGTVGRARSSGGGGVAGYIEPGMEVYEDNGTFVGVVESVGGGMIRLHPAEEDEGASNLPLELVNGVDDKRVILAARGDGTFGLGASA
ncbi:MAG: DUF2171 domain-containing protein [Novosphingobium sp.]|nr:DUF2171 domain-containing protein [Novosphingobium sp.]